MRTQAQENEKLQLIRNAKYMELKDQLRRPWSWTLIWDDLSNQDGALDLPIIEAYVKAGRHAIADQIFACQGVKDFKCKNRDQIAWLAMSPMISMAKISSFLTEWIPSGFDSPAHFKQVLKMFAAQNYWLIAKRHGVKSLDPRDFIFKYKASFSMFTKKYVGSPDYEFVHHMMFDPVRAQQHIMRGETSTGATSGKKGKKKKPAKKEEPVDITTTTTKGSTRAALREKEREEKKRQKEQKRANSLVGIIKMLGPQSQN